MTASRAEPPRPAKAGCAYFGVRILRHVERDLDDLVRRGFTGVLHTFSENDFAYYRDTMRAIVDASHARGLEVQMNPWGLGRTFGGEAESMFVTKNLDACQVLDDGTRVAAACLNHPRYRAYCKEWADAALDAGADLVFWDEPHWVVPVHVGIDDPERRRWGCRCDRCRERYGAEMPTELTEEVLAFREASLVDFLGDVCGHVRDRGGRNTICLLPATDGAWGVRDWDAVAALRGVDVFATDPYWHDQDEPAAEFVSRYAQLLATTAARHGVDAELWLPSFRLTRADLDDVDAAVSAARAAGIDRIWIWAYEGCAHMTHLATSDSHAVWERIAASVATPAQRVTERVNAGLGDLDRRPTRELVDLMNAEDRTVPFAVARCADEIAAAVDTVADALARGGRLIYAGAGSSGRIAAVDASECETTFAASNVLALVAGGVASSAREQEAAEDDRAAGAADVAALTPTPEDVVVAVSASGRTPYVLGAVDAARAAGAQTIAVVCVAASELGAAADREVAVVVGPELVAGSTRLKAGTAQKLVLNMLSTLTMIRLGKTYGNLMVDVAPGNAKLRERVRTIVATATGAETETADAALAAADGNAKVAIVSLLAGVDAATARERLAGTNDNVRDALEVR